MTNLSDFYDLVKGFADDHDMVNQFLFIGSEEELDMIEFDYKTFIMIPANSNISRTLNRPIYTLSFDCVVIDKYPYDNEVSMMKIIEENLFLAGQFQDFLTAKDDEIEIGQVDIESIGGDDYNVSSVMFTVDVSFARSPHIKEIIS